jgi:cytidylate kinase
MSKLTSDSQVPVITVDGPSGVGKGTISAILAHRLGWHMLDSGALYRLVGFGARKRGLDLAEEAAVASYARQLGVEFATAPQSGAPTRVILDGEDVTDAIRTEASGNDASQVAALAGVRAALLERQRAFRQAPGLVADGRDMGSTIFPDAELKIFLIASPAERAQRRHKQLKEKGIDVSLAGLLNEIADRDERDRRRAASPLRAADDAITIDTTDMGIDEVVAEVARHVQAVFGLDLK